MAVYDPVLDWLGRSMAGLFSFLRTTGAKMVVLLVAPFAAFLNLVSDMILKVETFFNDMISVGTNALGEVVSLNVGTMFAIGNSFFPIDLCFQYSGVLVSLWLVALVYRTIKSFIPTLS